MNNQVERAYSLSKDKKVEAKNIYELALVEMIGKDYTFMCGDAFVELSAIFGQMWLVRFKRNDKFWADAALYAEANNAFNYANLNLGASGRFVDTAKRLVDKKHRVSNAELVKMSATMDCLLTRTYAEEIGDLLFA